MSWAEYRGPRADAAVAGRAGAGPANLIENDVKYSLPGGTLHVNEAADGLELVVEDEGPGIVAEHRERVFDRFFRVPDQTQPGSGLGLAIVRSVAERPGAEVVSAAAGTVPGDGCASGPIPLSQAGTLPMLGEILMNSFHLLLHLLAMAVLVTAFAGFLHVLRRRSAWQWRAAVAGGATFVLAARVIEPAVLHAAGLLPLLAAPGAVPGWVIPLMAAAPALFEESGRLIALGLARRRLAAERAGSGAWAWSFAAGYAGAELLLVGLAGHGQLLWLAQQPDAGVAVLQALPAEMRAAVERGLAALGPLSALWLVSERLAACVFQVGLSLLVAAAVVRRAPALFAAALALHFLIDLPAAAYQAGTAPLWLVELLYAVLALAALQVLQPRWRSLGEPYGEVRRMRRA